jgi:branched-chain amino acid transport system permease protein
MACSLKQKVNHVQTLVIRQTRGSNIGIGAGIALCLVAASLPFWGESSWMREFVEIGCYFIFAMMWNLLAGFGGMVSVGQQAFFGLGAYALLSMGNFLNMSPWVAIPLSGALAAALSWAISKMAFRLQGGYFSIGTWVIADVVRLTIANISAVGGGSGTSLTVLQGMDRDVREQMTYWLALVCVVLTITLIYAFLRSKQGLALLAIRDSEVAAESQGVAVKQMKLAVYVVSAFGCGVAGALYLTTNLWVSPDAVFGVNWTAFAIFIVMIGGIGRIEGPLIGAIIFWALNKFLSDYGTWYQLGLGALAIVMTLFFREGVWGFISRRTGFELFPIRRQLKL